MNTLLELSFRITLATLYSHLGLVDDALALLDTFSETVSVQTEATPTVAMTTLPDERSSEEKVYFFLLSDMPSGTRHCA